MGVDDDGKRIFMRNTLTIMTDKKIVFFFICSSSTCVKRENCELDVAIYPATIFTTGMRNAMMMME